MAFRFEFGKLALPAFFGGLLLRVGAIPPGHANRDDGQAHIERLAAGRRRVGCHHHLAHAAAVAVDLRAVEGGLFHVDEIRQRFLESLVERLLFLGRVDAVEADLDLFVVARGAAARGDGVAIADAHHQTRTRLRCGGEACRGQERGEKKVTQRPTQAQLIDELFAGRLISLQRPSRHRWLAQSTQQVAYGGY